MAESNPITVGIVGLGRIGWDFHLKTLLKNPNFHVVACAEPLEDRRTEAEQLVGGGLNTFATAGELFKAAAAELAVICTRSIDHAPHALAAIKAGMNVVVEKPMAMNVRQADRMIDAAAKAGRVLTVNQSYRRGDQHRFVRETIDGGILGQVFWVRYSEVRFFRRNDWQQLKKNGGGFLYNNGAHSVDSALDLLGGPVGEVWADMKHTVTAGDADDHLKVVLRGQNGRVIEIEQSYACAFAQPTWLVCGTCGSMQIVKDEATIRFFDPAQVGPIEIIDAAPAGRRYGNDDKLPWQEKVVPVKPQLPCPDFYDNLAAVIRTGQTDKLLITPESVRERIRVMNLAQKSAGWKA